MPKGKGKTITLPGGLVVHTEAQQVPFVIVTYADRAFIVSQVVEPNSYVKFVITSSQGGHAKGSKRRVATALAAWDAAARSEGQQRVSLLNLSGDPAFDLPKPR